MSGTSDALRATGAATKAAVSATGGAAARRLHIKACPVTPIPPPRPERGRSDGSEKGNIVSGLLTRQQMSEHQRHKQEGPAEAVLSTAPPRPPAPSGNYLTAVCADVRGCERTCREEERRTPTPRLRKRKRVDGFSLKSKPSASIRLGRQGRPRMGGRMGSSRKQAGGAVYPRRRSG